MQWLLEGARLRTLVAGDVLGQLNGANEFAVQECPQDDAEAEESANDQKSKIYAQHSPKREETHCTQNEGMRCGCKYLQSCRDSTLGARAARPGSNGYLAAAWWS